MFCSVYLRSLARFQLSVGYVLLSHISSNFVDDSDHFKMKYQAQKNCVRIFREQIKCCGISGDDGAQLTDNRGFKSLVQCSLQIERLQDTNSCIGSSLSEL